MVAERILTHRERIGQINSGITPRGSAMIFAEKTDPQTLTREDIQDISPDSKPRVLHEFAHKTYLKKRREADAGRAGQIVEIRGKRRRYADLSGEEKIDHWASNVARLVDSHMRTADQDEKASWQDGLRALGFRGEDTTGTTTIEEISTRRKRSRSKPLSELRDFFAKDYFTAKCSNDPERSAGAINEAFINTFILEGEGSKEERRDHLLEVWETMSPLWDAILDEGTKKLILVGRDAMIHAATGAITEQCLEASHSGEDIEILSSLSSILKPSAQNEEPSIAQSAQQPEAGDDKKIISFVQKSEDHEGVVTDVLDSFMAYKEDDTPSDRLSEDTQEERIEFRQLVQPIEEDRPYMETSGRRRKKKRTERGSPHIVQLYPPIVTNRLSPEPQTPENVETTRELADTERNAKKAQQYIEERKIIGDWVYFGLLPIIRRNEIGSYVDASLLSSIFSLNEGNWRRISDVFRMRGTRLTLQEIRQGALESPEMLIDALLAKSLKNVGDESLSLIADMFGKTFAKRGINIAIDSTMLFEEPSPEFIETIFTHVPEINTLPNRAFVNLNKLNILDFLLQVISKELLDEEASNYLVA